MKADRPRLFILCGLPFTGKSTLARDLAARIGAEHVEIDKINAERGVGLDGAVIGVADWNVTYTVSFQLVERHLVAGHSVIYDATNYTREQRERLRAIADACRAEITIVYVALPEAEARRRWLANRMSNARYDVRDEDFQNVLDSFDEPGSDEGGVIRLDGWQSPTMLLGQLSAYLDRSDEWSG